MKTCLASLIIRKTRRNRSEISSHHYQNGYHQRGTKEHFDKGERRESKWWLKTQHLKETKIMASSLITSWQIDGETVETVRDFIFLGSKINCSHEIKSRLLLGRKLLQT